MTNLNSILHSALCTLHSPPLALSWPVRMEFMPGYYEGKPVPMVYIEPWLE